jgi:glycerol-3-phosphate acyltransferase PlsY
MSYPVSAISCIIVAYLIGSIPTGMILSKVFANKDIRKEGSGNIGATNVSRTLGKKLGFMTLGGDLAKGFLPVFLVSYFLSSTMLACVAGLAAFLGHLFPLYLKFRGGKGVATALGIFLYLAPLVILIEIVIFGLVVALWRYVSLGSLTAAATMPLLLFLFSFPGSIVLLSFTLAFLIFFSHRGNIQRLFKGTENKF